MSRHLLNSLSVVGAILGFSFRAAPAAGVGPSTVLPGSQLTAGGARRD